MSSNPISNPFSTGGGGTNFEQKIGTMYLSFLLSRQIPYGLDGIVKEIKFQQIHTESLDDIVIISERGNKERKLSLQLKHNLRFVDSDPNFSSVVEDCWKTLKNETVSDFDPNKDRFGVGIGIYQKIVGEEIIPIRNIARDSTNAQDFAEKRKSFSLNKKKFLDLLEKKISKIKGNIPTKNEIWQFLICFEIIHFDLEQETSKDITNSWNILLNLLIDKNASTAQSLFERLFSIVSNYNPSMGSITYSELSTQCADFPIVANSDFSSDINQLDIHTTSSLKSIRDTIDVDIHFKRANELQRIHELIPNNEMIVLDGEPLVGKSVLMKMLANEYRNDGECIFFKIERLENNSLQSFLHQLNITNNFEDILKSYRNVNKKYIFIDGLEHTTDANKQRIVNDILIAVKDYNEQIKSEGIDSSFYWKLICSGRTLDLDKILFNLETRNFFQNNTLKKISISGLEKKEKEEIVKKKANLQYLIFKDTLEELFSRPGILDLATLQNFPTQKETLEQISSESQFMEIFWQYVIRNNEMTNERGNPFQREQLVLKTAQYSLLNETHEEAELNIDTQSLRGLFLDRILIREGTSLVFVYDYVEDWVWAFLLKNCFSELFEKIQKNPNSLRRITSFRLLSQYLLDVEKNTAEWKLNLDSIQKISTSPRWETEWVAAPLLIPTFELTFKILSPDFLKNENGLFTKLLKTLRTVCVTYDYDSTLLQGLKEKDRVSILPHFTIPITDRWELILKYILKNFTEIQGSFLFEFSKICLRWMEKTNTNTSLRKQLAEKCIELSTIYLQYRTTREESISYEEEEKLRENLVCSVLQSSNIIPNKVDSFLRFYIIPKRPKDHHRIDELIIKKMDGFLFVEIYHVLL